MNQFKKISAIISILLLTCFSFGEEVALPDVRKVALNLIIKQSNFDREKIKIESSISEYTNDNLVYYIFNFEPTGFAIIAADDRIVPVIGYSTESSYSNENLPPSFEMQMDFYKSQIEHIIEANIPATPEIEEQWQSYLQNENQQRNDERSVPPLLPCNWDQGYPWNVLCPSDPNGPGGYVYSGCVAVSMVQVMYYWQYPEVGAGSHSYFHSDYGQQFADFENTFYDFEAMEDNVSTDATALLQYHAGVAIDMMYSPNGSGAYVGDYHYPSAFSAMYEHFLFDPDLIDFIQKNDYSDYQWADFMRTECDNNRPVIYRGQGSGGHAFNLDGYDDEDLFHFNWGWGGAYNGYYQLNALNPGGSNFNDNQGAIIGMIPLELTHPRIVLRDFYTEEFSGDYDEVINPGETANLFFEFENLIPFGTAYDVEFILTSENPDLNIPENTLDYGAFDPGELFLNIDNPFQIEIAENIVLGNHDLNLSITAMTIDGDDYNESYFVELPVSLNQTGFPTLQNSQIVSAPVVIDIDQNNSEVEIIFGDYNGLLHVLSPQGVERENFPFDTGDQIWGAPAVADIDNDGILEIVIGSKSKHLFILEPDGSVQTDYFVNQYTMGTPAIGNLDDDPELEIVFGGYSNPGKVYAINPNGSDVSGFPLELDERIQKGVALADFDNNGKLDIVCGTDDNNIYLIFDDGSIADGFPFAASDKFRTAPTVVYFAGDDQLIILAGCRNNHFYGITSDGSVHFDYETEAQINSTASIYEHEVLGSVIFFGSDDGYLYGIYPNGIDIPNFPIYLGAAIQTEPVFSDLNNDEIIEIIVGTTSGYLFALHFDGSTISNFPIQNEFSYRSAATIYDIDGDSDLEIVLGSVSDFTVIDVKTESTLSNTWNKYRYGYFRQGYYISEGDAGCGSQVLGDVNCDYTLNVGDLITLVNYILAGNDDQNLSIVDANQDGVFDILDIVYLAELMLS